LYQVLQESPGDWRQGLFGPDFTAALAIYAESVFADSAAETVFKDYLHVSWR
jgi:hypothetical protein